MPASNKFGTFSGVFTPSLLTILGVIMYMRLSWVVGQAGMIAAIGIIVIAHIISVTTGLSISSIATDKKIKAGGIYYMLSRTLGLPMGGAIGIALFLGTALSISLYIVGFAESFLSIPVLSEFLHLEPGVEGYRIVGTAIIIILVVIAFISTSLAIKSQYLILGAIFLSLISVFAGVFLHPEFAPSSPVLSIAEGDISLEMVFAIFFPAVTGFTAGVAMSGDLKDPKKSIPLGTIMAITVGFIVYITMAITFAFFVSRDNLINDTNIILKIAWVPALVIAGIWGATLSSALGGILGGPRILQALANDKLMPNIFGKGYGSTNEPRNALILIFLIAEGGILIGELNLIAGVVTMFYLASYGFINLAYVLESWASTDFRPSFRVSKIFGIVGFVFAFSIMFKLDVLSMLAAFAIMGGIYFFLKRRQLRLDFGDVWQSVWNSVVRKGLHRLSVRTIEERNWQPNIILFSGGTEIRSYLIEFGKSLVGKFGLLSNFDLTEEPSAKILFPKHKQQSLVDEDSQGIFTRRQSCKDIYDGIEMIARTYGFSGIEPNTVILGWARQTRNPVRFHQLLRTISELDYNILLIDYDKRFGYGKHQQIDIWWRGEGNNGSLALTLSKFMVSSLIWEKAKIRLMIVNYENDKASYIQRRADEILSQMRLEAEVKVINNQIDQKPVYDIIRVESKSADLVFAGIPEIKESDEVDFVERTSALLKEIGTVVLIKASSVFNDISLGINKEQKSLTGIASPDIPNQKDLYFIASIHGQLNEQFNSLTEKILDSYKTSLQIFINRQEESFSKNLQEFKLIISENLNTLSVNYNKVAPDRNKRIIVSYHQSLFNKLNKLFLEFKGRQFDELKALLETVIAGIIENQPVIWEELPETRMLYFSREEFLPNMEDSRNLRLYKRLKRIGHRRQQIIPVPFPLKKYFSDLQPGYLENLIQTIEQSGIVFASLLMNFQKSIKTISLEYENLIKLSIDKNLTFTDFSGIKESLLIQVDEMNSFLINSSEKISSRFTNSWIKEINSIVGQTTSLVSVYNYTNQKNNQSRVKASRNRLDTIVDSYSTNLSLLINGIEADNHLLQFNSLVNYELNELLSNTKTFFTAEMFVKIDSLINSLNKMVENRKLEDISFETSIPESELLRKKTIVLSNTSIRRINRTLRLLPSEITIMDEKSSMGFIENELSEIKTLNVSFSKIVEFLIENKIVAQLNQNSFNLEQSVGEQLIKIKEFTRLLLLTFDKYTQKENEDIESINGFLTSQINNISESKNQISQNFETYVSQIHELKSEVSGHLTLYGITKFGAQLKHYIHGKREQEQISNLTKRYKNIINWVSQQTVKFKYGKTQALAFARAMQIENLIPDYTNDLLKISDKIKPPAELLEQLPFYYKQLFSIRQTFHKEFWVPLEKEIELADIIIKQYHQLEEGVLLITGDQHSGKSFLSYILAQRWNSTGKFLLINPPAGGSIDLKAFNEAVADTFQEERYNDSLFDSLPKGSFVIFDDVELWWQRSDVNLEILNNILRIISKFRNRIFFILNINSYAYKLLDKFIPLSGHLLGVIKLNPLPVNSIKRMIMHRHQGTGLDIVYNNRRNDELSAAKSADLFVKIYKSSNGNPGVALATWLASIKKVDKESITIEPTDLPRTDIMGNINPDALLIVIQLLIHRQMTLKRIVEVMGTDPLAVERNVRFLWQMGMISKYQNDVYEINIYWYPVLTEYLVTKNYI